jgi:hypothetical protein
MALRLSMFDQLAPAHKDLAEGWGGHLRVTDLRDGQAWTVGPDDSVDVGETKVLISWRGSEPTGVLLPLDAVRIEQVHVKGGK